eukprot:TRINITY_DN51007_c0_g1_i1.p1 TRINITY_DN51007_c0_g1~~TRINITY_DN51007_c0_g1_i1.p1  ORF type:complete len:217 (+),score=38.07 TRINITY_DN51007_c0_g1_i1:55-651(+)
MAFLPSADELQQGRSLLRRGYDRRATPKGEGRGDLLMQNFHTVSAAASAPSELPKEPPFNLSMMFMDGSDIAMEVRANDQVRHLRSQVGARLGVTDARIKLAFGDGPLRLDETLGAAGLSEGSIVNVIVVAPLYKGTPTYERIAGSLRGRHVFQNDADGGEATVDGVMEEMMAKKAVMNDAFAQLVRERLGKVHGPTN